MKGRADVACCCLPSSTSLSLLASGEFATRNEDVSFPDSVDVSSWMLGLMWSDSYSDSSVEDSYSTGASPVSVDDSHVERLPRVYPETVPNAFFVGKGEADPKTPSWTPKLLLSEALSETVAPAPAVVVEGEAASNAASDRAHKGSPTPFMVAVAWARELLACTDAIAAKE